MPYEIPFGACDSVVPRCGCPCWFTDRRRAGPWTCNAPRVAFLEAAHATATADVFRVYFGGADSVIASAVVSVSIGHDACADQ